MKKFCFIIIIISLLLTGIAVYVLTTFNFNNSTQEDEANPEVEHKVTDKYISFGDFLKMLIENSGVNIDYDLVKSDINHYDAVYLKVAENYGMYEENSVTAERLDELITVEEAIDMCCLTDKRIRSGKLSEKKMLSGDVSFDEFLTESTAKDLLSAYISVM